MSRPFRRYCIQLSRQMGMTVNEFLQKHTSSEISELLAYDLTMDEDWLNTYEKAQENEAAAKMTEDEITAQIMGLKISGVLDG